MTDPKNLPGVINQQVAVHAEQRGSLVMRGLVAVQEGIEPALSINSDVLYREARTIFDKWWAENRGWPLRGEIDDPDLFAAFKTFQQLADNNYWKSYYPLSVLLDSKEDKYNQNHAQYFANLAIECCLANQTQQDVELWCDLGNMLSSERWAMQDDEQAVEWYRKAAEQGSARAECRLGYMYRLGQGVPQNEAQAVQWYRKAAEHDFALAQLALGVMYFKGESGVPLDCMMAAMWFTKGAEQGHVHLQNMLGQMYSDGQGVPQDYVQAVEWYRKAAEQGLASAQKSLGDMYKNGKGVPQDDVQAVEWYRKAAEQGSGAAQVFLGDMYKNGKGVSRDDVQAVEWYRKAAEQGLASAQESLGDMYKNGKGVSRDDVQAAKWYCKAVNAYSESSMKVNTACPETVWDEYIEAVTQANADVKKKLDGLGIDWKTSL